MTRRYIDFAPAKKGGASPRGAVSGAGRTAGSGVVRNTAMRATTVRTNVAQTDTQTSAVRAGSTSAMQNNMVRVGVSRINTSSVGAYASRVGTSRVGTSQAAVTRPVVKMPSSAATQRGRATGAKMTSKGSVSSVGTRTGSDGRMTLSKSRVKLGEIEDLNQKFVMKDVPKRPLGGGAGAGNIAVGATGVSSAVSGSGVAEAKAKKVGGKFRRKKAGEKNTVKRRVGKNGAKEDYRVPNSPFINQDKVVKRPLSKNVYQKQAAAQTGEKKERMVRIVEKPKKESHVGMVVAVILTIILGAVAGTVAFLLLPK